MSLKLEQCDKQEMGGVSSYLQEGNDSETENYKSLDNEIEYSSSESEPHNGDSFPSKPYQVIEADQANCSTKAIDNSILKDEQRVTDTQNCAWSIDTTDWGTAPNKKKKVSKGKPGKRSRNLQDKENVLPVVELPVLEGNSVRPASLPEDIAERKYLDLKRWYSSTTY